MKLKHFYLLLCIPGAALPLWLLGDFLQTAGGFSLAAFLQAVFLGNKAAAAVGADLFIAGFVFFVFVFAEGRRLHMQRLWAYIPLGVFIGISFALPLFLYRRQCARERLAV